MCKKIIAWLLRNVKVNRDEVIAAIDKVDKDSDGFFSLGELIVAIQELFKK